VLEAINSVKLINGNYIIENQTIFTTIGGERYRMFCLLNFAYKGILGNEVVKEKAVKKVHVPRT